MTSACRAAHQSMSADPYDNRVCGSLPVLGSLPIFAECARHRHGLDNCYDGGCHSLMRRQLVMIFPRLARYLYFEIANCD